MFGIGLHYRVNVLGVILWIAVAFEGQRTKGPDSYLYGDCPQEENLDVQGCLIGLFCSDYFSGD